MRHLVHWIIVGCICFGGIAVAQADVYANGFFGDGRKACKVSEDCPISLDVSFEGLVVRAKKFDLRNIGPRIRVTGDAWDIFYPYLGFGYSWMEFGSARDVGMGIMTDSLYTSQLWTWHAGLRMEVPFPTVWGTMYVFGQYERGDPEARATTDKQDVTIGEFETDQRPFFRKHATSTMLWQSSAVGLQWYKDVSRRTAVKLDVAAAWVSMDVEHVLDEEGSAQLRAFGRDPSDVGGGDTQWYGYVRPGLVVFGRRIPIAATGSIMAAPIPPNGWALSTSIELRGLRKY